MHPSIQPSTHPHLLYEYQISNVKTSIMSYSITYRPVDPPLSNYLLTYLLTFLLRKTISSHAHATYMIMTRTLLVGLKLAGWMVGRLIR
jgi:hypothetical protein